MFFVLIVSVPPSGMASRALTARLTRTCSSFPASARIGHRPSAGEVASSMCSPMARRSRSSTLAMTSLRSRASGRIASRLPEGGSWGGGPRDSVLDVGHVGAGFVPAPVDAGFGGHGESAGDERGVAEDDREEVVEVVGHPAGQLAQGIHPLDLPYLGVQSFVLLKSLAALTGAPRVDQVL